MSFRKSTSLFLNKKQGGDSTRNIKPWALLLVCRWHREKFTPARPDSTKTRVWGKHIITRVSTYISRLLCRSNLIFKHFRLVDLSICQVCSINYINVVLDIFALCLWKSILVLSLNIILKLLYFFKEPWLSLNNGKKSVTCNWLVFFFRSDEDVKKVLSLQFGDGVSLLSCMILKILGKVMTFWLKWVESWKSHGIFKWGQKVVESLGILSQKFHGNPGRERDWGSLTNEWNH